MPGPQQSEEGFMGVVGKDRHCEIFRLKFGESRKISLQSLLTIFSFLMNTLTPPT